MQKHGGTVMLDRSVVTIPEKFMDHPLFTAPVCGMNVGFMARRGYYETEEMQKQPELMKNAGVNWVTLNMNCCQKAYYSRDIFLDFEFSTGEIELMRYVELLHKNDIHVLFKPCLTPLDGMWMGSINFPTGQQIQGVNTDYWTEWFNSFKRAMKYFSHIAEVIGMDAMLIGAEYRGTESKAKEWNEVIEIVRENFSGPISYEFTPASCKVPPEWFKNLDFLSYSYYPPAAPRTGLAKDSPDYTREQMEEYLKSRQETVKWLSETFGNKPVVFSEYGVRSAHGLIMQPENFTSTSHYDGQQQADYMEASFNTFYQLPQWMGLFWWKWDETQDRPHYKDDPNGDKGFTIQGKPAEKVLVRWFKENFTDKK